MALCPFASYRPVPNHGGAMSAHVGVVIHVTAGEGTPYNTFDNPANQVSSHFGILNGQGGTVDGAIEQYVDTALTAWAECDGNASYVSVETEGEPTESMTPAQVQSFARLYQWIAQTHNVPFAITDTPGAPGFILHGDGGAAWGGHTGCPGSLRAAQRQQVLDLAQNGASRPMSKVAAFCRTPSGRGYYMAGPDGGVFAEGDAAFHGSMAGRPLAAPVVGIAVTAANDGYWLVASDGGVFAFGNAPFFGSMGGRPLVAPIVAIGASSDGRGYWLAAADGGIFAFGDAPFEGAVS